MPRPWRDAHTDRARALRQTSTDAERRLWNLLRGRRLGGFKFRRQYAIGNYIADFVCVERRLIVELDGGQHAEADTIAYDATRNLWFEQHGYRVLRLWNAEFLMNVEDATEAIWVSLRAPSLLPAKAGRREGRMRGFCGASTRHQSSCIKTAKPLIRRFAPPSPRLRGEKGVHPRLTWSM
ncbi:MAG TPA: endonuclease domain-containing protein [Vineibacter sp.]|nr:endonuclease domain-containing protein [Vineibacter sp.]